MKEYFGDGGINILNTRNLALNYGLGMEVTNRVVSSSAGPIPQKAGMGIAIPQKESIHLLHKNSK